MIRELRGSATHATYLIGPRGVEYRQNQQGTLTWYLYDGLGSVVAEVNDNTNDNVAVQIARTYDVYGAVRSPDPDTSGSGHKFCGKLGHTSEDETGLIYVRARYYDPLTGRFISEDPAGDGANWYGYCRANPLGLVDRDGALAILPTNRTELFEWVGEWFVGYGLVLMKKGLVMNAAAEAAMMEARMVYYCADAFPPPASLVFKSMGAGLQAAAGCSAGCGTRSVIEGALCVLAELIYNLGEEAFSFYGDAIAEMVRQ